MYAHKGKLSLASGVAIPFLLDRMIKYSPLKNKVDLLKKYKTLSFPKKMFGLTPLGIGSSILSYLLLTNIPFTQNKTAHFVYPLGEKIPAEKNNEKNIEQELKNLHLEIKEEDVINDASYLNKTPIAAIVIIKREYEIKKALNYAGENNIKVSIAGARHSMGGQAFVKDGVVLDMNEYKEMKMSEDYTLSVQSGALFSDIQHFLDKQGLYKRTIAKSIPCN
jgi:hypothetical protein